MRVEAEGKFMRVHKALPYMARVTVCVDDITEGIGVSIQCSATSPLGLQGDIDDVPAIGFNDWKQGAIIGARHALAIAKSGAKRVTVTRIMGMETDTNPTVVGAATINAVWKALGYTPTTQQTEYIERIVFSSWQIAYNALPNFEISSNG